MVAMEETEVIVICPKCKIKLKVSEEKLTPEGKRFKCPKCASVFVAKRPVPVPKKAIDYNKVLVAHSDAAIVNEITSLLNQSGYQTVTASEGIEAIISAFKEVPFLIITEVSLPKIYGFEVCKRVRARPGDKGVKFLYVVSSRDKKRYERELASIPDTDDYIEDHLISAQLVGKIHALRGIGVEGKREVVTPPREPVTVVEQKPEPHMTSPVETVAPKLDDKTEKARRLARTIVSDIYLYSTQKVEDAIRNNDFYAVFASEIKEGLKLYEARISQEVRARGDFFKEAIEEFIANKKKVLGL